MELSGKGTFCGYWKEWKEKCPQDANVLPNPRFPTVRGGRENISWGLLEEKLQSLSFTGKS